MPKILFLPKYPRMGASSRLRTYQYLPLWEKAGYEVEIFPFFNETYLNSIYAHRRPGIINVLGCYFKRLRVLAKTGNYDLIWIEKEIFPFLPSYAEWILKKFGQGYVVDFDDAVFHNYDQNSDWLVQAFLGNKIDRVMRFSKLAFVGNDYIGSRAVQAGAKSVTLLPTVIQSARYRKKTPELESQKVSIGWIGSPSTLKYLLNLRPVFKKLAKEFDFELLIVNAKPAKNLDFGLQVKWIPWSEETEVDSILRMDIGVMPLPDSKWERGKCAYKLIQYMACGLPVVASPVGMNKEVVQHGENGFLATSLEEWEHHLSVLIQGAAMRKRMGDKGYELVQRKFTVDRNFELMKEIVSGLLIKKSI